MGLVMCMAMALGHAQPNISRVEYYIDNDPGYGNGITVNTTSGNNVTGSFNIDLEALSQGVHIVGVRSRDANGVWGLESKWIFLKPYSAGGNVMMPNINRIEYFVDTDPGYGNGIPLSFSPATSVSNVAINLDLIPLTEGVHIVGIRSRDDNGAWSIDNKWIFLKPYATGGGISVPNITRVEYFIDNDPGYGNAINLPINASTNIAGIPINIDLQPLAQGVHIIGVRSRDTRGAWSIDNKWLFLKPYVDITGGQGRQVTQMEYYIDNDPGYGNGVPIALTPAGNMAGKSIFANITNLNAGEHFIYLRSRDQTGAWSIDNRLSFTIGTPLTGSVVAINSTSITSVCKEGNFTIGYHVTGAFNSGNQFIAELSDANGSFASPVAVGSITSMGNGLIPCTIPAMTGNAVGYKMRVRSTNPAINGLDSEFPIQVYKYFVGNDTTVSTLCNTRDITNVFALSGATVIWSTANPTAAPVGTHEVKATNSVGCKDTASVTVAQEVSTWLGTSSSNWFNAANWSSNKVPGDSTHVIINSGTPNACSVSAGGARAASLQLKTGATINIAAGFQLQIKAACTGVPAGNAPPGNGAAAASEPIKNE